MKVEVTQAGEPARVEEEWAAVIVIACAKCTIPLEYVTIPV